jgi:hypothetical protein
LAALRALSHHTAVAEWAFPPSAAAVLPGTPGGYNLVPVHSAGSGWPGWFVHNLTTLMRGCNVKAQVAVLTVLASQAKDNHDVFHLLGLLREDQNEGVCVHRNPQAGGILTLVVSDSRVTLTSFKTTQISLYSCHPTKRS